MFFGSRDYHLGLKNSNTAFCFPQLKIRKPNYDLRAEELGLLGEWTQSYTEDNTHPNHSGSSTCRQSLTCESLEISSGPVSSISIMPVLGVSCLCILRMLREKLGPGRERNHPLSPPCPLPEGPNTLPDICCFFHCLQLILFS